MKILYDYTGFIQHHGGVSRYHVELIRHLSKLGVECDLPFLLSENVYLDEVNLKHLNPLPSWKSAFKQNVMKWIDQKFCLNSLAKGDYDIFHTTGLNPYFIGHTKGKVVIPTMYDLINEKFPEFADSAIVKVKRKKILDASTHILAISQQTKNDLLDFYGLDEKQVSVVYLGGEQDVYSTTATRLFDKPYILFIGNRRKYKNFENFARAFALLKHDVDLVCTGVPFSQDEMNLFSELKVNNRVHQMFATTDQMNQLLAQAELFVYPSKAEGFGLPILEAYRCGCPCIISDILCFHEVAGDAAVYFDPLSVEAMTDAMDRVLTDSSLSAKLRADGFERLKMFSWEKTAINTLEVYKSLI